MASIQSRLWPVTAAFLLAAASAIPAAGHSITGIVIFACTPVSATVCNATGPAIADTVGGNSVPNIYVFSSSSTANSPDNPGNGAGVSISYVFDNANGFAAGSRFQPLNSLSSSATYGINFFVDGNTSAPAASLSCVPSGCSVNAGTTYSMSGASVPGAGTDRFSNGATSWRFAVSLFQAAPSGDLVGPFNNAPDGNTDYLFYFGAGPGAGPFRIEDAQNFSVSAAEIDTINNTNVTQQATATQVELKARMQGGAFLYDQTFKAALTDPTVQAAITSAQALLTKAGATSFAGPTLLSSSQSTSSSSSVSQVPRTPQVLVGTATFIGPATVTTGNLGVCQSYAPYPASAGFGANYFQLSGCSLPNAQAILLSSQATLTDTLATSLVTIDQTTTITNTTLTSQVYELDGIPNGNPNLPATPAPPSLMLALTGVAALALFARSERLRRRRDSQ